MLTCRIVEADGAAIGSRSTSGSLNCLLSVGTSGDFRSVRSHPIWLTQYAEYLPQIARVPRRIFCGCCAFCSGRAMSCVTSIVIEDGRWALRHDGLRFVRQRVRRLSDGGQVFWASISCGKGDRRSPASRGRLDRKMVVGDGFDVRQMTAAWHTAYTRRQGWFQVAGDRNFESGEQGVVHLRQIKQLIEPGHQQCLQVHSWQGARAVTVGSAVRSAPCISNKATAGRTERLNPLPTPRSPNPPCAPPRGKIFSSVHHPFFTPHSALRTPHSSLPAQNPPRCIHITSDLLAQRIDAGKTHLRSQMGNKLQRHGQPYRSSLKSSRCVSTVRWPLSKLGRADVGDTGQADAWLVVEVTQVAYTPLAGRTCPAAR